MTADEILARYGQEQKTMIDEHIRTTCEETEDATDALQYMDDIVYDIEGSLGQHVPEEDEAQLRKYIKQEIENQFRVDDEDEENEDSDDLDDDASDIDSDIDSDIEDDELTLDDIEED